jgi:hypothetical protein
MATLRQKKAIQNLVESGGKSVSKAMISAGYSAKTAKTPAKLTESKGFQNLLASYDPKPVLDNLYEMARSKKDKRAAIQAASELFKLSGSYKEKETKLIGYFGDL